MTGNTDGGNDSPASATPTRRPRQHPPTRQRGWVLWGLGAVLTIAGVSALITGIIAISSPTTKTTDLEGRPVHITSGAPTPEQITRMNVQPTGERFIVPAVGLNVPLSALNDVDNTITPPGFTSAYLIRNLGVPLTKASQGTVFIAMHSVRGGGTGPGNALINVASGTARVHTGNLIRVGPLTYTITGWDTETKTQVPRDTTLWANTPNRLIILTCMQLPTNTESTHNLIITATLTH